MTGIFLRELLFPWSEQDQLDGRTGIFYIHMFSDICMFYCLCELHYNLWRQNIKFYILSSGIYATVEFSHTGLNTCFLDRDH